MEVEYKNIDPKLVVAEIRNGRSLEAVQKLFGIKLKSEVQDLYLKGLMELGEIPKVDFGKERSRQSRPTEDSLSHTTSKAVSRSHERPSQKPSIHIRTTNFRTIGQSGSITLNKVILLDQLGFSIGDSFEIYREDDSIVLKKIN